MKLTTIALGVIAGSALAYNAYSLTCAQQPTCDSLGYTLTSTSDCIGTVLKCPFDASKYYCIKKDIVLNTLVPNYDTHKELLPNGTYYTVGSGILSAYSCGWVLFRSQGTNTTESEWWINSALVGAQFGEDQKYADYNTGMYLVSKGDKFKLIGRTNSRGTDKLYFFPCKNY